MLTRRQKVQEKRMAKSAIFFIISSIALLVLLLIVGVPALARLTTYIGSTRQSQTPVDDKTAPVPPLIDELPRYTKENKITITGRAEANTTLKVYLDDNKIKESAVGETSIYFIEIALPQKRNTIWVTTEDRSKNESARSRSVIINYISEPPILEINKPGDKQNFYGDEKNIPIEGKTDNGDVAIKVNDRIVIVSSDGSFSQKIGLSEGENTITVTATDLAGNTTEKKITVTYSL